MTICNQVDNPISMSGFVIKPKHKFDSIIVDLAPRFSVHNTRMCFTGKQRTGTVLIAHLHTVSHHSLHWRLRSGLF